MIDEQNQSPAYKERIESLAKDLVGVTSNLGETNLGDVRTIPERIFKEIFLPLLHGDVEVKHGATLQHWISYAGSMYSPVHVVANNNPKEILFTVPPYYDRNIIRTTSGSEGNPIAHIIKTAEQYGRIQPAVGQQYLQEQLDNKTMIMSDASSVINNLNVWDSIFMRYGLASMFDGLDNVKNNPDDTSIENNNDGNGQFLYPDD